MADLNGADDPVERIARVQRQAKRASKRIEWQNRLVHELEATRRKLERATRLADLYGIPVREPDIDPPALEYVTAVRTPQRQQFQAVTIEVDGEPCIIGLRRDRPTGRDPIREGDDWSRVVSIVRKVRAQEGRS